ncbi:MAG TPA: hypothetical protein VI911_11680 [Patescibacteria group bacterium]|nr:hypothetical protein [Patescibacteria group bacterium]
MEPNNVVEQDRTNLLLTGVVSDFQLQNLKIWPKLVFDNLDTFNLKYDFCLDENSEKENSLGIYSGTVEYDFIFKKGSKVSKKTKERALHDIANWVRFLFWSDTEVIFKRKGKRWI